MRTLVCAVVLAAACGPQHALAGDPLDSGISVADDQVRLNQLQMIGTHNSYKKFPPSDLYALLRLMEDFAGGNSAGAFQYQHLPLLQQLDKQGVRHFELDVFHDPNGDLYDQHMSNLLVNKPVQSNDTSLRKPGYKVMHVPEIDYQTVCSTLVGCLAELKDWSDRHNKHLPISILIQPNEDPVPDPLNLGFKQPLKTDFVELENEIRQVIPDSKIITPEQVRGSQKTLREGVLANGWPTLKESRGKFIFFLDAYTDEYVNGDYSMTGKLMFPSSEPTRGDMAYITMNDPFDSSIPDLVRQGFLVRTRADELTNEARAGNTTRRDKAIRSGAQFVSTDYPAIMQPTQLSKNIQTNYMVSLPPRCNPVNSPDSCRPSDLPSQQPVDPPNKKVTPVKEGEPQYSAEKVFPQGIGIDPTSLDLFRNWSVVANLDTDHNVTIDEGYVPAIYSPSSLVTSLHAVPRLVGGSDLTPNAEYVKGIVLVAVPFVAVALVGLLISMMCLLKCQRCQLVCRRPQYPRTNGQRKGLLVFYVTVGFLALSGCFVVLIADILMSKSLQDAVTNLRTGVFILNQGPTMINTFKSLAKEASARITNLTVICPEMFGQSIASLPYSFGAPVDEMSSFVDKLSVLSSGGAKLLDLIDLFNTYQAYIVGCFIALVIINVFLFSTSLIAGPFLFDVTKRTTNLHRARSARICFVPTAILLVCLSIPLLGVILAVSVALADFCVSVDDKIVQLIPVDAVPSVQYYFRCSGPNEYLNMLNYRGEVIDVFSDMGPILGNITSLQCAAANRTSVANEMKRALSVISRGDDLLDQARGMVSCRTINGLYGAAIYKGMCHEFHASLVCLWVGMVLAAIGSLCIIWFFGTIAMAERLPFNNEIPVTTNDDIDMTKVGLREITSPSMKTDPTHKSFAGSSNNITPHSAHNDKSMGVYDIDAMPEPRI